MKLTSWLNHTVKTGIFCLAVNAAFSQTTTLKFEEAQTLARANYPIIKQKELISQTAALNISNISKGYLPQLNINGQATYQSDVTSINVPIPNIKIDAPGKDQYKIYAEASQLIYDGGQIKAQKEIQEYTRRADDQQLEVELYKVRQRISTLHLSILYLNEQLKQIDLIRADILTGIKRTEAQVNNGIAFRSNLNVLKAELLKTDQREDEIAGSREGLINTLSVFVNRPLNDSIILETPGNVNSGDSTQNINKSNLRGAISNQFSDEEINRPELKQFADRSALLGLQQNLIKARNKPKTNLFIQGGYGRPALNLLKNQFEFYYIGGIRLTWNLGGLYTSGKEKQLVGISQRNLDVQQETFLLNTKAELATQRAEISKLAKMIATDSEIITLRNQVRDASKAQLDNGVITASDYVREINAADQAVQAKITHEIQLLQAKINYQNISGKY